MQIPTLKTYVTAVLQPYIYSLKQFYDRTVLYMQSRMQKQDIAITDTQVSLAETKTQLITVAADTLECRTKLLEIEGKLYTSDDVKSLERRVRELNYIAGALYDLVYNKLPDESLPDFDHPVLPGETIPEE